MTAEPLPPRSESEIVADVVVELIAAGLIAREQVVSVCRFVAVNVETVKARARLRDVRGRYLPPADLKPTPLGAPTPIASPAEPPSPTRPLPQGKERGRHRPERFDHDDLPWLRCSRCPAPGLDELAEQLTLGIDDRVARLLRWREDPEAYRAAGLPEDFDEGERSIIPEVTVETAGHWAPAGRFAPKGDARRDTFCAAGRRRYAREHYVTARALDAMSEAGIRLVLGDNSAIVGVCCKECGEPFRAGDHVVGDAVMFHEVCAPAHLDDGA